MFANIYQMFGKHLWEMFDPEQLASIGKHLWEMFGPEQLANILE